MTLLLVLIKIVVAGAFGVNISRKVTEERSTLRREFYIKFAKVSVDPLLFKFYEPWACVLPFRSARHQKKKISDWFKIVFL